MTDDPHFTAYQREFEQGGHDPDEPDHSWLRRYDPPVRNDDRSLSIKGVVAGVCGGIALAILLIGLAK